MKTPKRLFPIFLKATNIDAILIEIIGENKNLEKCQLIWNALSSHHFERNSLLINLGGGVVGDMGGFAASLQKRYRFYTNPNQSFSNGRCLFRREIGIDFACLKNQIGYSIIKKLYINPVF